MKKITLIAIMFLGLGASAQAQQNISATILNQFNQMYENAEDVDWEEANGRFSAYFILNENYVIATFLATGKWLESSFSIDESVLPNTIISFIKNTYPTASYTEVIKIKRAKVTQFKIELATKESLVIQYLFDDKGKVLKKEIEDF